jgi:hypothetical protein
MFCGFVALENDHNTSSFQGDHLHKPKDLHNAKPNGKSNQSLVHKTKQLKKHSSVIVKPTICTRRRAIEKEGRSDTKLENYLMKIMKTRFPI